MTLDPGLAGRTYGPTASYQVSAEKIREFNTAIGARPLDGGNTAPLTFPIVVAFPVMEQMLSDDEVGIDLHNVVHGAQRFDQVRPLRVADVVSATLTIDSVRSAAGADVISTRTEVVTTEGDVVCTATATLVHRADES
jgi:acyl dehydratase